MLTNHNAKRANAQLGWFFVGSADSSRQQNLPSVSSACTWTDCLLEKEATIIISLKRKRCLRLIFSICESIRTVMGLNGKDYLHRLNQIFECVEPSSSCAWRHVAVTRGYFYYCTAGSERKRKRDCIGWVKDIRYRHLIVVFKSFLYVNDLVHAFRFVHPVVDVVGDAGCNSQSLGSPSSVFFMSSFSRRRYRGTL